MLIDSDSDEQRGNALGRRGLILRRHALQRLLVSIALGPGEIFLREKLSIVHDQQTGNVFVFAAAHALEHRFDLRDVDVFAAQRRGFPPVFKPVGDRVVVRVSDSD